MMKTNYSKRILSVVLSILMVISSLPAFALTASAADGSKSGDTSAKYLMAYFTGNGSVTSSGKQQAIRFAVSEDGSNYTALNGNAPAILQTTGSHNARDPYIFKGHDGDYYLVATDADYSNGGWGNAQSTMTVWHSSDLTHWDNETHIDISKISGYTFTNYCWAPQVIWDDNADEYMIYFATSDGSKQTIHYIYTTDLLDFSKYEAPKQLVDFNYNGNAYASIDADITYYNGKYIMFFKDESNYDASTNPGGKKLAFSVADKLGENAFTKAVILNDSAHDVALEGPQFNIMADGTYSLLADYFGDSGNFYKYNFSQEQLDNFIVAFDAADNGATLELSSLATFDTIINNIRPRHGSVVEITTPQYETLKSSFADAVPAGSAVSEFSADSSNLVARYLVNDATTDVKGGTSLTNNSVTWSENQYNGLGAASFTTGKPGSYLYAQTSTLDSINANDGMTFSFLANADADNISAVGQLGGRFFEFNNKGASNSAAWATTGNSCISVSNSGITEVMNNDYSAKTQVNPSILRNDAWHLYTISIDSSEVCLYVDGAQVGKSALGVNLDETLTTLRDAKHFIIGGSFYQDDNTYAGQMRDFRVYNKAITATQAKNLSMQYELDTYDSVSEGTEVYGNVTIDPIVYVHGTNAPSIQSEDSHQYDYMMYGSTIADGSYDGECSTAVSINGKTLSSVVATDTGKALAVTDGKLTGDLGGNYGSLSNYTDKSTVTLKFTFNDGTYEIHKLAVKPNPVATHTAAAGFQYTYSTNWIGKKQNEGRVVVPMLVLAKGSYGQLNAGSMVNISNVDGTSPRTGNRNFAKMYSPYSTKFDAWESDNVCYIDSMTSDPGTFDKTTGFYYTASQKQNGNSSGSVEVKSGTATYYLDASSSNNYGITYDASNKQFSIDILTSALQWSGDNLSSTSTASSSASITSGDTSVATVSASSTPTPSTLYFREDKGSGISKISGTVNGTGTSNFEYTEKYVSGAATRGNTETTTITTAISLVVSNKTTERNYYAAQINDLKNGTLVASDYSVASWKAYTDALLELEYFLNDNTQTDAGSYQSNVYNARQNLVKLTDVSGYKEIKSFLENTDKIATDSTTGTPTLKEIVDNGNKYTQDSIDSVNTIITIANKILANPQTDDSLYAKVSAQLEKCESFLMPKADETNLNNAIDVKSKEKIYNGGVQTAPLADWLSLQTDVTLAKKTVTDTQNGPRYATDSTQVELNGVTYTFETPNTSVNSAEQQLIESTAADLNDKTLTGEAMDKTAYDAAFTAYSSYDSDMFTNEDLYNALYAQLHDGQTSASVANYNSDLRNKVVYASTDDVKKYEDSTGTTVSGNVLMNDVATSDQLITYLLEFTQDESNIKHFNVTFGAQIEQGTESSTENKDVKYGTLMNFNVNDFADVSALGEDKRVKWTVATGNKEYRVSTNADSIDLKIVSDVTVTAEVVNQKDTHTNYVVKFYNLYGNVDNIGYTPSKPDAGTVTASSITLGGVTYRADAPFYEVTGYKVSEPDANNVISVHPIYTMNETVNITVIGGTATSDYMKGGSVVTVDRPVTITSNVSDFYAWAVQTNDGTYQIASYNKDYTFKTYVDETYVPIVKTADGYAVYSEDGNTSLEASMIKEFSTNASTFGLENDAYLKAMLDSKAPFVAVQSAKEVSVNGETKYRMYIRITAGSDGTLSSFGVAKNGTKIAVKSRNTETGQLSVTLNGAASKYSSVQAYASYNFTYTFKDKDYNIVTTDYASIPTNA